MAALGVNGGRSKVIGGRLDEEWLLNEVRPQGIGGYSKGLLISDAHCSTIGPGFLACAACRLSLLDVLTGVDRRLDFCCKVFISFSELLHQKPKSLMRTVVVAGHATSPPILAVTANFCIHEPPIFGLAPLSQIASGISVAPFKAASPLDEHAQNTVGMQNQLTVSLVLR